MKLDVNGTTRDVDADPSTPLHLKTVWGVGYRFDE